MVQVTSAERSVIDDWTTRLTGLPGEAIDDSRAYLRRLNHQLVDQELVDRPDIDSAAGSVMVVSAIRELVERGIPESKLTSKLRRDPEIWATTSEIIAAAQIARYFGDDRELKMDAGNKGEPNSDLRISIPDSDIGASFEIKSIGLSHDEVSFFGRSACVLPQICPKMGVLSSHAAIESKISPQRSSLTRAQRRDQERHSRKMAKNLPLELQSLTAATVVGYFTEQAYLVRAKERIEAALRQLPKSDECWVALWWSNGASSMSVYQTLSAIDLPKHILGLILTGSAVVCPSRQVHHFTQILPREELVELGDPPVVSLEENPLAETIFGVVEESSGPRPTLIAEPGRLRGKPRTLLFRDGSRRFFPFNLVLAPDHPSARQMLASEGSN